MVQLLLHEPDDGDGGWNAGSCGVDRLHPDRCLRTCCDNDGAGNGIVVAGSCVEFDELTLPFHVVSELAESAARSDGDGAADVGAVGLAGIDSGVGSPADVDLMKSNPIHGQTHP